MLGGDTPSVVYFFLIKVALSVSVASELYDYRNGLQPRRLLFLTLAVKSTKASIVLYDFYSQDDPPKHRSTQLFHTLMIAHLS